MAAGDGGGASAGEGGDQAVGPIVEIAYPARFRDTMAQLRAAQASGELSPRTLALTSEAIALNGAAYTVWQLRRQTLDAGLDAAPPWCELDEEQAWLEAQVASTPKNYQLWNHRRWLAGRLAAAAAAAAGSSDGGCGGAAAAGGAMMAGELLFTAEVLRSSTSDEKNYHAWAHRQWALGLNPALWPGELRFTTRMLASDVRNNSAWSHRAAALAALRALPDALPSELEFTLEALAAAPENEAPWTYLRHLLLHPACGASLRAGGGRALRFAAAVLQADPANVHALAFAADAAAEAGAGAAAVRLFGALEALDPPRARYWRLRGAGVA